ncbi:MAG: hypothetical protein KDD48_01415 [Bdellovibrionales bacterium]|nr:hypothetical protein [Bdellovibrionales bacterium]
MKKKQFGEILLEKGLINPTQLEDALKKQPVKKIKLGEMMVALGYIHQEQLTKLLGDLAGIPAIDLQKFNLEKDASKYIGFDFCEKHLVVPIAAKMYNKRNHLLVAFADPLDLKLIDEIRFMVSLPVFRVVATPKAIEKAIQKIYPNAEVVPKSTNVSKKADDPTLNVKETTNLMSSANIHRMYIEIQGLKKIVQIITQAIEKKKMLSHDEIIEINKLSEL